MKVDANCNEYTPTAAEAQFFECYIKPRLPNATLIDALLHGITDYECDTDKVYQCNDIAVFKGAFYESLKNDNDRHPHDDKSWKQHGSLKDIFTNLSKIQGVSNISIEYHNSCGMSQYCKPFYGCGDIVAVMIDTGEFDSCGNAIVHDVYYVSTANGNIEMPSPNAENWSGPFNVSELLSGGALSGKCDDCETDCE